MCNFQAHCTIFIFLFKKSVYVYSVDSPVYIILGVILTAIIFTHHIDIRLRL